MSGPRRARVLVAYGLGTYPLRASVAEHLEAPRRYSRHDVTYVNLALRRVPRALAEADFDLVIFHTSLLSARWQEDAFLHLVERAAPLRGAGRRRIVLPQDEFLRGDLLCRFIEEFEVDEVLSVSDESEWPKIYREADRERLRFRQVLTGYLDEESIAAIESASREGADRTIDIGYRAWRAAAWLGRHGHLKAHLADVFREQAPLHGLVADISTRPEDTILGQDWNRFLLRCKYTIGVEGGATLLDWDGSLKERVDRYEQEHPAATFDEIEAACFPGRDGELDIRAISPRHLEACATRTCQILVEGSYNGILRPGEHYLELRADLSNLDEVLAQAASDDLRAGIVERAYRDVVASGRYNYRAFAGLLDEIADGTLGAPRAAESVRTRMALARQPAAEWVAWRILAVRSRAVAPLRTWLKARLPAGAVSAIGAVKRRVLPGL